MLMFPLQRRFFFLSAARERARERESKFFDHVPVFEDLAQVEAKNQEFGCGCTSGKDSALKRGIGHTCTFNIKAPN